MMIYPQTSSLPDWQSLQVLFTSATSYEERYRQLLLLGKKFPAMPEDYRQEQNEVSGCESRSWVYTEKNQLWCDSEARIIRGLMTILLSLVNHSDYQSIKSIDLIAKLEQLGLRHYISESRINGIQAIWQQLSALQTI
ncbi:SufE family protein [Celerinatantimonas diazotrophica]|uniref:Cysteine desulfuration protein SufE n=1 Tax=Celerinatantimonas diazotrophica TaxID=412034 RepID=A0A4R1KGP0_9GAMM|nr:SufE family protein [Celerinatantimonas diazotrophica]TCK63915.1 cysteine desulfuration protein SufE [Celerinatantimonas diazotrophica]CAG9297000.1 Sulfur acceptor protein CsdE [Celerinatantimonas diazotrophica]